MRVLSYNTIITILAIQGSTLDNIDFLLNYAKTLKLKHKNKSNKVLN